MATETELQRMVVRFVGDSTHYAKTIEGVKNLTRQTGAQMKKESENVEVFGKAIDNLGTRMSSMAGQMIAFRAIQQPFESLKGAISAAGDMEQLEIAFRTIIGDAGRAETAIKALVDFADKTPFEMPEVVGAAKQMLAMGTVAEDIVPTMKMLGDVSAGLGIRLGDLTYIFGTLQSQGRAFTVDINQFAMRGIPIWDELGKIFGKTKLEVRKLVEEGKVGFAEVEQAFKNMTGEGGRFHGMTEEQSKSFNGMLSTLQDSLAGVARAVGKNAIEVFHLKEIMDTLTGTFKKLEQGLAGMGSNMKVVISYVVALTASSLVLFTVWKVGAIAIGLVIGVLKDMIITLRWIIPATWAWIAGLTAQTKVVYAAAAGQAGLNGVMTMTVKTNWAAVAAATALRYALIGLVVGGVTYLIFHLTGGTKILREFNEELKKSVELSTKMLDLTRKRFEGAVGEISNIAHRGSRKSAADEMAAQLEKEIGGTGGMEDAIKMIEKQKEEFRELISKGNPFKIMERRANIEALDKDIEALRARIELAKKTIADLKKIAKEAAPEVDPEVRKALDDVNNKLAEQIAIWGMTADQAVIAKLKIVGATDEMVVQTQQMQFWLSIMDAAKKAREAEAKIEEKRLESIADMIAKLQQENHELANTAEQVDLMKIAMLGADEAEIAWFESLQATNRELKRLKDLMEEGKKVTEQFRTPNEVLIDQWNKLEELFNAGAIDLDTFNRAIEDAETKFWEATSAVKAMKNEVESLDAVLAGGAEAKARIASFGERNAVPGRTPAIGTGTALDMTKLLAQIVANTGVMANKPTIELEPADVDEAA